ncbi:hypothetical protein SPD48_16355 [Pseudogracilibacillus sp. SE30717A]|uniref:hypothetical protein n=1 Tax=Pseudogracilibacillus sp. SE30717A TaxID=3098293 RepID=UPI00300E51E7
MYKGFKVVLTDCFSHYHHSGEEIIALQNQSIWQCLDNYINPETGALVGDALERDWFPVSAYDVFISHSHEDAEQVVAFAGYLQEKYQLSVFIDSAVWRSADSLVEKIHARYGTDWVKPDYRRRDYQVSHVYMLMAMALGKVIDRAECFMFITTPNSVKKGITRSPWIYAELMFTKLMKKRLPSRWVSRHPTEIMMHQKKQLAVEYDVCSVMSELLLLQEDNLQLWEKMYQSNRSNHPLDLLYAQYDRGESEN